MVSDIEEPDHDVSFQRGGDLTIEIISSLCNLSEENGAPSLKYARYVCPLTSRSTDSSKGYGDTVKVFSPRFV